MTAEPDLDDLRSFLDANYNACIHLGQKAWDQVADLAAKHGLLVHQNTVTVAGHTFQLNRHFPPDQILINVLPQLIEHASDKTARLLLIYTMETDFFLTRQPI